MKTRIHSIDFKQIDYNHTEITVVVSDDDKPELPPMTYSAIEFRGIGIAALGELYEHENPMEHWHEYFSSFELYLEYICDTAERVLSDNGIEYYEVYPGWIDGKTIIYP